MLVLGKRTATSLAGNRTEMGDMIGPIGSVVVPQIMGSERILVPALAHKVNGFADNYGGDI